MWRNLTAICDPAALKTGFLLVNGLPCAFHAAQPASRKTGPGETAAGVRFRAFPLAQTLHPHIPAHAPLLLEWVDKATSTVVAAARWHVWNPRNQPYCERPRDEAEARSRHADRWENWPQTIGQRRVIPKLVFPPEGKHTLDLRRHRFPPG